MVVSMRLLMGIIRGPNGVFYARKKVPSHLTEAVAQAIDAKQPSVSWLKRSLSTRDLREANIVGKPVLIEFDGILAKAEALLKPLPARDNLSQREINRIADYYYAERLAEDDDIRLHDEGSEEVFWPLADQLSKKGIPPNAKLRPPPTYGLSQREMEKIGDTLEAALSL
jgi:hypothetical protein